MKLKELVGKRFKPKFGKAFEKEGKFGKRYYLGIAVDGKDELLELTENEHKFYFKNIEKDTEYEVYQNKRGYPAIRKVTNNNKTKKSLNNYKPQKNGNKLENGKKISDALKKKIFENFKRDFLNEFRKDLVKSNRFTNQEIDEIMSAIKIEFQP